MEQNNNGTIVPSKIEEIDHTKKESDIDDDNEIEILNENKENIDTNNVNVINQEEDDVIDNDTPSWKFNFNEFTLRKMSDEQLNKVKKRNVKQFYEQQNEYVDTLLQIESPTSDTDKESKREDLDKMKNLALNISMAVNILLFFIKIYAAITSGSLSVIASALDSFLDLLSSCIIYLTDYLANKSRPEDYPSGNSRFEPVGIVIFSTCMFTATLELVESAIERIVEQNVSIEVDYQTLAVLGFTIIAKFFLWLFCRSVKGSSSVDALATDHINDVLSNLVAATSALLGFYVAWYIDPLGAILISGYLLFTWGQTGYEQLGKLVGTSASPDYLSQLTYLARNHHELIQGIDTVRAYHFGERFLVEMDIILSPEMPLKQAHDIGESLQNRLEDLDTVERAFVHLDYEGQHKPEHANTF